MKSEDEVKNQLLEVYRHRLMLRVERKTKHTCRNCKHGMKYEFDFGDFGTMSKWVCKDGKSYNDSCGFSCLQGEKEIEDEMIADISDPSVCGAKEPKIAMLLWVLHGHSNGISSDEHDSPDDKSSGILNKIKGWLVG